MSTTVTYKGNTLTTVNNATKTLKTAGKYMEGDVILTDTDNTLVVTLSYNESTEKWEPDKTYAEIQAAYEAGKTIAVEAAPNESRDTPAVSGNWTPLNGGAFTYETHELHISSVGDLDGTVLNVYFLTSNGIVNPSTDILWLTTDATATPADVLSGKVFYNADGQQTGTATTPTPTLQSKSVSYTPSETAQSATVTADSGYDGLSSVDVSVGAISSTYVGSGITQRSSTDLTASGATVTVPAGYYSAQASKAVASGTEGTPTATKGTVSNHSVSVTPSVTNTAGYIAGGTKSGTAVTVSASELVSGTYTVDSSGTKDITNYASISVPSGSATAPASITGTAATVSAGTNTLTLTKSVSVTPSVTAGYISSGTAGDSSVSLTASVPTKAAATITPGTTDQTIATGTYLTGTQTIAGDADLVANNIISTANIFGVQGSVVVQNYYTGSSEPSSSLGQNGDIYLQE